MMRIFSQLVCALHYLHREVSFVHGDIKLENLVFDEHNNISLSDLSLGKTLESPGNHRTTVCGSLP
jgi:serine/threonine protein kinase